MEKIGIKESKEAIDAMMELTLILMLQFKDGVQIGDFTALWAKLSSDPIVKAKMMAAYENYKAIPKELGDIDAAEGVDMSILVLSYVPKIIEALRKDAA